MALCSMTSDMYTPNYSERGLGMTAGLPGNEGALGHAQQAVYLTQGFETVGGHQEVIQQLREIVLLPLQYSNVFRQLGREAPRSQAGCC